jgi:hypothetical protein
MQMAEVWVTEGALFVNHPLTSSNIYVPPRCHSSVGQMHPGDSHLPQSTGMIGIDGSSNRDLCTGRLSFRRFAKPAAPGCPGCQTWLQSAHAREAAQPRVRGSSL